MTPNPEDELLDQSLRNKFSDFDLPPANHVWKGIEGHLAVIPPSTRPLPLHWLLPAVALVGVGVGWLLPRPASWDSSSKPAERPHTTELEVTPRRELIVAAPASGGGKVIVASLKGWHGAEGRQESRTIRAVAAPRERAFEVDSYMSVTPADAVPSVRQDSVPALAVVTALVVSEGTSSACATGKPLPDSVPMPANVSFVSTPAANTSLLAYAGGGASVAAMGVETVHKSEGQRERRLGYRAPTHRMAEKGRGLRRHLTHFTQQLQHIFEPRRSRAAAKPDF